MSEQIIANCQNRVIATIEEESSCPPRAPRAICLFYMDLVHDLVHNPCHMEFNVHEAKTNFSKLLQRVALGEEVIIAKAGVPVAKLVPVYAEKPKRPLGLYKGQIWIADDFNAPLPDDILAGFLGEDVQPGKIPARTEVPAQSKRKKRK